MMTNSSDKIEKYDSDLVAEDKEFNDYTIHKVKNDGDNLWKIYIKDFLWFICPRTDRIPPPQPGDEVRIYGNEFGPIRGVFINGEKIFYRNPQEQEAHKKAELERQQEKNRLEYEKIKPILEKDLSELPTPFQARITRFRKNNPEFWEFEPYEIMVCKQAVIFANKLKTDDAILSFAKLSFEKQKHMIPEIEEGHSGNSFMAAVSLARVFISKPDLIEKWHGALCPLVGCEVYGCYASELKN